MEKSNDTLNSSSSAGNAFLPAGELKAARDFMPHLDDARSLRSAAPVFVTTVDLSQFEAHRSGAGSFRMGAMEFDDCVIVTARLQMGGMQFIWLADASDNDVWRAIDNMQRTKQAAFVFVPDGNPSDMSFIPWPLAGASSALDRYRRELGHKNGNFLAKARELINSKAVEEGAQSVIPGVSLKVTRVNLLLTKRLKNALASHGVSALMVQPLGDPGVSLDI
ncbi:hypothetical protein [Paraburkholderia sp. RL17-347-BIC-D]|uniref:hypothetical protein n=1 Tax=Paraburkholderia sp. RL17-347-BIC-D TaxID=3031632 RepID=UPI0038B844C8